jgi:hypothetical protein
MDNREFAETNRGSSMAYEETIRTVRDTLCAIFAQVDGWFDRPETLRRFRPASVTPPFISSYAESQVYPLIFAHGSR